MTESDRPGREIANDYREVALYQVDQHGWRYDSASGRGGHPVLYPADRSNGRSRFRRPPAIGGDGAISSAEYAERRKLAAGQEVTTHG